VADILSSRSGDCTEHAVLLAALLRKAGLPARIAYGFLLTEAGFIGHAWTEAYDGTRWHWLDASFPGGRPYRFRLRLGVLDPALPVWQQMGLSLFSVAGTVRAELLEAVDER
jgi:transglutaminase-like putative cysteine protease